MGGTPQRAAFFPCTPSPILVSTPTIFAEGSSTILNVASDLFIEVLGRERGTGTRLPIAAVSAGHNYSMLMDMIVEVKD